MTIAPIETPRLRLRSTRESDGEFCLSLWLDETVGRYLSDPPRELADEAELNFAEGIEQDDSWYPFVIEQKDRGERIGTCSLVPPEKPGEPWDLGYALRQDMWRKGYGTEALTALMGFARSLGARSFTAEVAKANDGSNALLRKLGFRPVQEGTFRKRLTDIIYPCYLYRLDDV